jgi:hypothetical protein
MVGLMKTWILPLPARPGTLWRLHPTTHHCESCGKPYNSHGAPEDVAQQFNIPLDQRHLICPASDQAWEEYDYQRRIASYESTRQEVIRALTALKGHDATVPLDHVIALLPEKPAWRKK